MIRSEIFTPIPTNVDPYPETIIIHWAQMPGCGVWVVIGTTPLTNPDEAVLAAS